jgi:sugar lactone lactonase YvrE
VSGRPARTAAVVAGALAFPECVRWHGGRWWLVDMHTARVLSYDADFASEPVVELELDRDPVGTDARTAGIGFLPDGRLLAVSSVDATVRRREADGRVVVHAALGDVTRGWCNDMLVDPQGRAYVGSYGADFRAGEKAAPVRLAFVDVNGTARAVGEPLWFPNGMALTPDGRTLVVAESLDARLTAFTVGADGSLSERRVWARLPDPVQPDGVALDAAGAVWVASFGTRDCIRVQEGGAVTDRVVVPDRVPFACGLGGPSGRTLVVCAANTHATPQTLEEMAGVVAVCEVEVGAPSGPLGAIRPMRRPPTTGREEPP